MREWLFFWLNMPITSGFCHYCIYWHIPILTGNYKSTEPHFSFGVSTLIQPLFGKWQISPLISGFSSDMASLSRLSFSHTFPDYSQHADYSEKTLFGTLNANSLSQIFTEENRLTRNLSYQRRVNKTEYFNLQTGQQSQLFNPTANKNNGMTQQ